jgi:NAD(P)-dependent dehydrogenase (short-subunit alcohol dehydrogenase family)
MPVAVVTGGASGIGLAAARRLGADGYRVWLADIDSALATEAAASLRDDGVEAEWVAIDIGDSSSVARAFESIGERESSIDALVLSAGIIVVEQFESFSAEQWERALRINVIGAYLCLQAALPLLRHADGPARVVLVASTAGKQPGPFTAPYNASKAAMISLGRSAAVALAPEIVVNSVCPGVIDTPMWRKQLGPGLSRAGSETTFEARGGSTPAARPGTPEEVAAVIAFLAGPDAAYVVGEDLNVNGGLAMY